MVLHNQVSSLLSVTYVIPWPPFYEALLIPLGSLNIDIGWFRQPLNTLLAWIDEVAGDWSCNLGDMSAKVLFGYHYGLLAMVITSVVAAYGIALCLHKSNVCKKKFGPTFKKDMAQATGIKTFMFFLFLLCVRRADRWGASVRREEG